MASLEFHARLSWVNFSLKNSQPDMVYAKGVLNFMFDFYTGSSPYFKEEVK